MRLGTKVVFFLSGCVLGVAVALGVATQVMATHELNRIEEEEAVSGGLRIQSLMDFLSQEFGTRATDWSNWDDMAQFVADGNQEFIDSNVDSAAFEAIGWDLFAVLNREKGPLVEVVVQDGKLKAFDKKEHDLFDKIPVTGDFQSGYLVHEGEVWMVASRPVRRSGGLEAQVEGRLVVGHRLDEAWDAYMERISSEKLHFQVQSPDKGGPLWKQLSGVWLDTGQEDRLSVWVEGPVLTGEGWVLRLERERETPARVERFWSSVVTGLLVGSLVMGTLVVVGVHIGILRPIRGLLYGIRELERGSAAQVVVGSGDELGDLALAFNRMSRSLKEKERALATSLEKSRLVLDSTTDALVLCSLQGALIGMPSRAALQWFGEIQEGGDISGWLFANMNDRRIFQLGIEDIQADFLPVEVICDQLPKRIVREKQHLQVTIRPVSQDGRLQYLLLLIQDVTAAMEAEQLLKQSMELKTVVRNMLGAPVEYQQFVAEIDRLLTGVDEQLQKETPDPKSIRALVHTIKGSSGTMGFVQLPDICHQLESELDADAGGGWVRRLSELVLAWEDIQQQLRSFLPEPTETGIHLSVQEHQVFLRALQGDLPRSELVSWVRGWRNQPLTQALRSIADSVPRLADQLGKQVRIEVSGGMLRADTLLLRPVLSAIPHLIRNALVHGIERPEVRQALGKSKMGHIQIKARMEGRLFLFEIADDGAGIDWARVREQAVLHGLPHATAEDLTEALFSGQVSTAPGVSELAGRGIGLTAVYDSVLSLGGQFHVITTQNHGTCFQIRFPLDSGPLVGKVILPNGEKRSIDAKTYPVASA